MFDKSEYRGLLKVFNFTLKQMVIQKTFYISFIITLIAAIAIPCVMNYKNKSDKVYECPIHTVYVYNNTEFSEIDFNDSIASDEKFKNTKFEKSDIDSVELGQKLNDDGVKDAIIININKNLEKMSYEFRCFKCADLDYDDVNKVMDVAKVYFEEYRISNFNVDKDFIEKGVGYEVVKADEFFKEDNGNNDENAIDTKTIDGAQYNVIYASMFIIYMIVVMSSSVIATRVVEEKASKIVEYLVITVKPMALVMGKILSMIVISILEYGVIIVVGLVANNISAEYFGASESALEKFFSPDIFNSISPLECVLGVIGIINGFLMFGIMAGLFGASVSKLEDIQQGLKVYNIIIIAAFFMCLGAVTQLRVSGTTPFTIFTEVFPFTSVLILHGALLIGRISIWLAIISIVLQIVTIIALVGIVSLVYESIIVMNGNIINVAQMVKIAKNNAKSKKIRQ